MRFFLAILAIFMAICIVPDRWTSAAAEPETETLYTWHTCDSGRWYFETSDEDSVTVNCYHPDPSQNDSQDSD